MMIYQRETVLPETEFNVDVYGPDCDSNLFVREKIKFTRACIFI